jgi:hypothetical protein
MIGLDFVKRVDKDWKKHITFADGRAYCDDFCPVSRARCRQEDCLFWDQASDICKYIQNQSNSSITTKINIEKD